MWKERRSFRIGKARCSNFRERLSVDPKVCSSTLNGNNSLAKCTADAVEMLKSQVRRRHKTMKDRSKNWWTCTGRTGEQQSQGDYITEDGQIVSLLGQGFFGK